MVIVVKEMAAGSLFAADQLQLLIEAFDSACDELGLQDREDIMAEIVAKAVVQVGKERLADPASMKRRAMALLLHKTPNRGV